MHLPIHHRRHTLLRLQIPELHHPMPQPRQLPPPRPQQTEPSESAATPVRVTRNFRLPPETFRLIPQKARIHPAGATLH